MRDLIAEMGGASPIESNRGRDLIAEMGGELPIVRTELPSDASIYWNEQLKPSLIETGKQIFEIPKSLGEVGLTAGTGALGWLVGSGLGVAESLKPGSTRESVRAVYEDAAARLTYQPRTQPAAILMEKAGRGIEALTGPAKEAAALVGESWDSPFLEAATKFIGEVGTFKAAGRISGIPKAMTSWLDTMPYRKRVMVIDQIKADLASGEFTTAQIRDLWKDPANRAELLKRYQRVGETGQPVRAAFTEPPTGKALPEGQGFELRPRPSEVRDILAEMGEEGPKGLPMPEGMGDNFIFSDTPELPDLLRKDGKPFMNEAGARNAIKREGVVGYEPVQVEGGWVARSTEPPSREFRPESVPLVETTIEPSPPPIVQPGATSGGKQPWEITTKALDETGVPITVYRKSDIQADYGATEGKPIFFGSDKGMVGTFGGKTGKVYEAKLDIKNPYYADWNEIEYLNENPGEMTKLKAQGYDGIIEKSADQDSWQYIVFDKSQIKPLEVLKDYPELEKGAILPPVVKEPGTANIPPETAPKAVGGIPKELEPYSINGKYEFNYLHNTEKAPRPGPEDTFGQKVEPAGKYMNLMTPEGVKGTIEYGKREGIKNWETGTISFDNPLIIQAESMSKDWKTNLSEQYNGLTGKKLSAAIRQDGYDGIITMSKGHPSEVVSLPDPSRPPEAVGGKYNQVAIKKYGLATADESIGYITRDGKGIDSSGKKQGSRSEGRNIDHRQIAQDALGDESTDAWSKDMRTFMDKTGDIRVVGAKGELNIDVPIRNGMPTAKQLNVIERMAEGKKTYYDFTDEKGNTIASGEGTYGKFKRDLNQILQNETEIKAAIDSGKIPAQLQPMVDFIRGNNLTKEQFHDIRYNDKNPLHETMNKLMDRASLGINKTWDDFGFSHQGEFYDRVTQLPKPSRPPKGGGTTLTSGIDPTQIIPALKALKGDIQAAMPHLEALGRTVYEGGKQRFLDWQAHMKTKLGDLWDSFKGYLRGIWDRLQSGEIGPLGNDRGSVNLRPAVDEIKWVWDEVKKTADEYMGAISTRLGNIDPSLKNTLRVFEFRRGTKATEATRKVLPFIEKVSKIPKADRAAFDLARKNGNPEELKRIVIKYGLGKEYHTLRTVLADIYKEATAVGYDVGYRQNYHPRVLKDTKGFLEYFYKQGDWPILEKAIRAKETELQRYLTDDEKARVINYMLRGYPSGNISLSKPGQLKAREIETITPALNKFYMDSDGALLRYINDVTDAIEARKLFGKGPKGGKIGSLNDTIGGYVLDLLNKGKIKPEQERVVRDILDARFNEVGTRGIFGLYKNMAYIDTMGSPISAITQIGDLSWALYKNGIGKTLTATGKAVFNRSLFRKEDIGIERIASEFADTSKLARAVDKTFKIIGLTKIDNIGKESLINSTYVKARQQAMTDRGTATLRKELEPIFEGETNQLIKDLRTGEITENVKLYLFNTLSDFQPISLSEMPQKYLSGGNGRIFYMLKSFTMKQFDVYRREIFQKIGTEGKRLEGIKNMVYLTAAFVAANASADFIKDWLLGRPINIEDKVVDNMLRLLGISKFVTWKAREEGAGSAMVRQIAPPFKALDAISKDINKAGDERGLEIVQSIPVVGKLYYWWFGKGAEKSEKKRYGSMLPATLVSPKTLKTLR